MLAVQRREVILTQLEREGSVTVSALARLLDVSEMTVRRDLDSLDAEGFLNKVHGGATSTRSVRGREVGFSEKAVLAERQKRAIAKAAARLVEPGAVIGLSAGTTTFLIAQELLSIRGITVITNGIRIADVFSDTSPDDIHVIVTGGSRTMSDALVGPLAITSLRDLNIDIFFMGVHGMDEQAGFTAPNLSEAETNRTIAGIARQFIVVADSSKWGEVGLARITPLDEATALITDTDMQDGARQVLSSQIGRIEYTEPEADTHA